MQAHASVPGIDSLQHLQAQWRCGRDARGTEISSGGQLVVSVVGTHARLSWAGASVRGLARFNVSGARPSNWQGGPSREVELCAALKGRRAQRVARGTILRQTIVCNRLRVQGGVTTPPITPGFLVYYSGETGYTHSLSPSRPPNNTLNTRQQRTQVQGHISHTRARADRRVPRMLRIRSGRGRHSVRTVLPQIEAAELHEREEPRPVVHVVQPLLLQLLQGRRQPSPGELLRRQADLQSSRALVPVGSPHTKISAIGACTSRPLLPKVHTL